MHTARNNRKFIFFLILLSSFAYLVSKKLNRIVIPITNAKEYTITEKINQNLEPTEEENDKKVFLELNQELDIVERIYPAYLMYQADILGANDDCPVPIYEYSTNRKCRTTKTFDYDIIDRNEYLQPGSTLVFESFIELVDIVVPPLINGSRPMDTSVRQIESAADSYDGQDHWTQRPDGEQTNKEVVEGNAYPGDNQTKGIVSSGEAAKTKRFSIEYYLAISGGIVGEGTNEYVIHEYQKNTCGEDCRNEHNPTPEKSLLLSYVLARSKRYPTYYDNKAKESIGKRREGCYENNKFYDLTVYGEKIIACTLEPEKIKVTVTKPIPDAVEAEACSVYDYVDGSPDEYCEGTASLVVIMESPWGVEKICEQGEAGPCVIEYNEVRNGDTVIPGQNIKENFYVLSDCKAYIEGIREKVDLKCAWDINHLAEELEFQSNDNLPGEIYPDKDTYLRFQIEEAEKRTDAVYEM
jgi:hypothetical protein